VQLTSSPRHADMVKDHVMSISCVHNARSKSYPIQPQQHTNRNPVFSTIASLAHTVPYIPSNCMMRIRIRHALYQNQHSPSLYPSPQTPTHVSINSDPTSGRRLTRNRHMMAHHNPTRDLDHAADGKYHNPVRLAHGVAETSAVDVAYMCISALAGSSQNRVTFRWKES
jgi:hypothetical protein